MNYVRLVFGYALLFNLLDFELIYDIIPLIGVWRSPASVLAWGVRGPRFESEYPDFLSSSNILGELFQLD